MNSIYKKIIILINIYFLFTIFLYFLGPLNFDYNNSIQMFFFVSMYFLVFGLGYKIGITNTRVYRRAFSLNFGEGIVKFIFLISVVSLFIFSSIQIGSFNPIQVVNKLLSSASSIGEVYYENLEINLTSQGSLLTQLQTLFSPLNYAVVPLGIILFDNINSKIFKIFWGYTVFISIVSNYITGTNIGIFRITISIVTSLLVLKFINKKSHKKLNFKKNMKRKMISLTMISLLVIFIIIFTYNISSRMPENRIIVTSATVDWNHPLLRILPFNLKTGFIFITSYLTQGYLGMSYALNYAWKPTFFIGNSMFLVGNLSFLGYDIQNVLNRTYAYQASNEWSPTVNWHTAFTWWANDFSFVGVILFMFLLGILFATVLKLSFSGDKVAILLLSLLVLMLIFIPMNNTVLSNPLTFLPFVIYSVLLIINNRIVFIRYR